MFHNFSYLISNSTQARKSWVLVEFIIFTTLLVLPKSLLLGQNREALTIYPTAGISWRSPAVPLLHLNGILPADPTIPYPAEKNIQGFSLNPGLQLIKKSIGIEYSPNLRYDIVSSVLWQDNVYNKEFIVDHNFNLLLCRKKIYSLGYSIINAGKGFEFVNPNLRYHNIEFRSFNLAVTFPIKEIFNLEIKTMYSSRGFPDNPEKEVLMFTLRAYYRFNFLN
jgi:hypothetical protein